MAFEMGLMGKVQLVDVMCIYMLYIKSKFHIRYCPGDQSLYRALGFPSGTESRAFKFWKSSVFIKIRKENLHIISVGFQSYLL